MRISLQLNALLHTSQEDGTNQFVGFEEF